MVSGIFWAYPVDPDVNYQWVRTCLGFAHWQDLEKQRGQLSINN